MVQGLDGTGYSHGFLRNLGDRGAQVMNGPLRKACSAGAMKLMVQCRLSQLEMAKDLSGP